MLDHRESSSPPTARRGFIAYLLAGTAAFAAGAVAPRGLSAQGAAAQPDPDWMKSLTGRHRTVFDVAAHRDGKPLAQAKNYLDGWGNVFHVSDNDLNLVLGVHGDAFPIVLADSTWSRFNIGELYKVTDASTKGGALRNVFTRAHAMEGGLVSVEQTVEALQRRGVLFLVCNNTVAGATQKLAAAGLGAPEQIRPALLAGLLPGVKVVPAMVVALTQLQEAGLRYTKIA